MMNSGFDQYSSFATSKPDLYREVTERGAKIVAPPGLSMTIRRCRWSCSSR
jgi:hypothetical protein